MADNILEISRAERLERQQEFYKAMRMLPEAPSTTILRTGVYGRAKRPAHDTATLLDWQRRNELVYSCVEKIADASMDPVMVVQERTREGEWQDYNASHYAPHPLTALLSRPNPAMDEIDFRRAWIVSEHIAGIFYAEIERSELGLPVALWPLNPAKVTPRVNEDGDLIEYEWNDPSLRKRKFIPPEKMLVRRAHDITNPYGGLPPLLVALGSVDADSAQTDYVRSFFAGGGQPSGVITSQKVIPPDSAEMMRQSWMARYGRRGAGGGPAVLDDGMSYTKVGANPDEVESSELRQQFEARICGVFGVPPALVGAYVGLKQQNNRASAKAAMEDFWVNKMSPLFTRWRSFLTHALLPEFESQDAVLAGKVRVHWDMTTVMALQEDLNDRHKRALEALKAGAITMNQYRAKINEKPDDNGDIYYLPDNVSVVPAAEIGKARDGKPDQTVKPAEE